MAAGPVAWIRSLAFNIAFWAISAVMMIGILPAAPLMSARAMRRFAMVWMQAVQAALTAIAGIRHEVRGLENLPPGPVIFASKHQSAWETLLFNTLRPDTIYGLKHELGRIPLFGWYLARGGNIFVDREGAAKALRSLVDGAKRAVGEGCSIVVFPEGTRRAPGAPPDYKPGIAALYTALNVPVVPVALNSGLHWPRRSFIKRPGTIIVELLLPIQPGLSRRAFMDQLETRIEARQRALEGNAAALDRPES